MGIVSFPFVLDYPNIVEPAQRVALLLDKQMVFYMTNLLMYVVFGVFLILLVLALYERLNAASPLIIRAATIIGFIWAALLPRRLWPIKMVWADQDERARVG